MKVNVGRIVKKRIWTVKTWRVSTKQYTGKILTEDINSALTFVMMVNLMRDNDTKISMSSKVITVIEED